MSRRRQWLMVAFAPLGFHGCSRPGEIGRVTSTCAASHVGSQRGCVGNAVPHPRAHVHTQCQHWCTKAENNKIPTQFMNDWLTKGQRINPLFTCVGICSGHGCKWCISLRGSWIECRSDWGHYVGLHTKRWLSRIQE